MSPHQFRGVAKMGLALACVIVVSCSTRRSVDRNACLNAVTSQAGVESQTGGIDHAFADSSRVALSGPPSRQWRRSLDGPLRYYGPSSNTPLWETRESLVDMFKKRRNNQHYCDSAAFAKSDGRVFVVGYRSTATGAHVLCLSESCGEVIWSQELKALGDLTHSAYWATCSTAIHDGFLVILGKEGGGRYLEVLTLEGDIQYHEILK